MEAVEKIAGIFGPMVLFLGLWSLFYKGELAKVVECVEKSSSCLYLLGLINLLLGLGILNFYNTWTSTLPVLVTLLGWVMFIRGLFCFFIPGFIHKILSAQRDYTLFSGLVSIFWGGALCYIAFM
ncbi:hypothetical protein COB21_02725 [Candidatus Aerophobetes bacterium]|uniref:Uncharacterized protein n=1 Tax=Aerophobetes bacterium TaxID=2030807 RepID=A0A2A4X689_UNCAE|nr:MAG: hypothetical protein COB21_02725 [Candidatus Aerophobetes bacterium]